MADNATDTLTSVSTEDLEAELKKRGVSVLVPSGKDDGSEVPPEFVDLPPVIHLEQPPPPSPPPVHEPPPPTPPYEEPPPVDVIPPPEPMPC